MKLIMAIINSDDSRNLLDRLACCFSATVTATTGGFLRVGNTTIFCGVADDKVDEVLGIVRESCPNRVQYVTPLPPVMEPGEVNIPTPVEKHVGGATIFVLDVADFEKVERLLCGRGAIPFASALLRQRRVDGLRAFARLQAAHHLVCLGVQRLAHRPHLGISPAIARGSSFSSAPSSAGSSAKSSSRLVSGRSTATRS